MIRDKRRSLDRAVWSSYQAAEVVREDAENRNPVRALINPNKLKQDYDDKIISIGFEYVEMFLSGLAQTQNGLFICKI